MSRETAEKVAVTVVLVAVMAVTGCQHSETWWQHSGTWLFRHLWWLFVHANVWHLCGNLFVLWIMRKPLYLVEAMMIAVAASFLPVVPGVWDLLLPAQGGGIAGPVTVGFSGVLFAIIGVKWGVYIAGTGNQSTAGTRNRHRKSAYLRFCKKVLPFAVLGALVPHINWSIHTWCLLIGLAYGRWK